MSWVIAKYCLNDLTSQQMIHGNRSFKRRRRWFWPIFPALSLGFLFFGILMLGGCPFEPKQEALQPTTTELKEKDVLAQRGRTVYQTQCTMCHHSDPHRVGALGPAVFGSSKELLEARILRAEYPRGYVPKRTTRSMVPLKHLTSEIAAIHAYLNQ